MEYENHTPAEGINVSQEHPLKEFAQLLFGITAVSLMAIWLLSLAAGWFAQYIPFSYEQNLIKDTALFSELSSQSSAEHARQQEILQALADRLSAHMDLPEGMQITVHYSEQDTVNALATLGGNVVFFKGLVDKIKSEQALATVMAHEIAHVKLRHPIVAAGKGLTIATLAAFISGASGSSAGSWLLGNSAQLTLLKYSRDQESAADALAAAAIHSEYGNVSGALELFQVFTSLEEQSLINSAMPQLYSSHPFSEQRAEALIKLAYENNWATTPPN